jgi:HTH-type transcriptional regulator/antitoxin HigA
MAIEVKPIRTKRDHEAALKEIERLWGTGTGTPEGDRLDVLATLVDAYEAEHYPMDPPDPIEAIKFRMEQPASRDGTWKKSSARAPGSPKS